jgi:hypothetical protein
MTIYRLLKNTAFGPEEIERLIKAYELTLRALGLTDRSDPITQLVAEKIFAVGRLGIEDPAEISRVALKSWEFENAPSLGVSPNDSRLTCSQPPGGLPLSGSHGSISDSARCPVMIRCKRSVANGTANAHMAQGLPGSISSNFRWNVAFVLERA